MKQTPWARYGSPQRMIALNQKVFNYLGSQLESQLGLKLRKQDDRYDFGTCIVNGTEVYNIKWIQSTFVSDDRMEDIKQMFPFKIGNIEFELSTIFDYDYDDERDYLPSIAFTVKELSPEQTRDDQIFIYWEQ